MLQPALNGTLSILKSAQRQPSVKRVVITSSFAAIRNLPLIEREPDHNFTCGTHTLICARLIPQRGRLESDDVG